MSAAWGGVFNHLWQSTVFAAVAALLALGLRKNHARARYWLWLAASCKFLVPFSLLVSLGVSVGTSIGGVVESFWRSAPAIVAQPEMTMMIDEISQPFTLATVPVAAPARQSILSAILPEVLLGLWIVGCAIVLVRWLRRWSRVRAAVGAAKPIHLELPVQLNMGADGFPRPLPDGRGSVSAHLLPDGCGSVAARPLPDGRGSESFQIRSLMVAVLLLRVPPLTVAVLLLRMTRGLEHKSTNRQATRSPAPL